jgi:transposase
MTTSIEAKIIKMHLTHCTFNEMVSHLSVGRTRIARTIREFHQSGIVPEALRIGRPRKSQSELVRFIEAWTLREASISTLTLSREIGEQFGVPMSRTTVNTIRKSLRFKYRPPRHGPQRKKTDSCNNTSRLDSAGSSWRHSGSREMPTS